MVSLLCSRYFMTTFTLKSSSKHVVLASFPGGWALRLLIHIQDENQRLEPEKHKHVDVLDFVNPSAVFPVKIIMVSVEFLFSSRLRG